MAAICVAIVVMLVAPTLARAQKPPDHDADAAVTASIASYLWVTGFTGTIDVVDRVALVNATRTGAPSAAKLASCAALELRAGRTAMVVDLTYATLADVGGADASGREASPANVVVRSLTLGSLIGYRVVDASRATVDLLVGVRIVHFGPSLSGAGSTSADLTDTWAESIGGARVELRGGDAWSLVFHNDAGGKAADIFGSSLSWHAEALARWRFSTHASVVGGYKRLYIRRHWQPLFFDGAEHGVSIGLLVDGLRRQ
jgi:hypothetical protein